MGIAVFFLLVLQFLPAVLIALDARSRSRGGFGWLFWFLFAAAGPTLFFTGPFIRVDTSGLSSNPLTVILPGLAAITYLLTRPWRKPRVR